MTKPNFTAIVAVIDNSGSMSILEKETIQGYNSFIETQKKESGEAAVTLVTFNSHARTHCNLEPIASATVLTEENYRPTGYTALYDAVGSTISSVGEKLAAMKEEDRPSKILFLIMTDGQENASRKYRSHKISEMVQHQKAKYSWEFVFIGANQDAIMAGKDIGIGATNSFNYVASPAGAAVLFDNVTRSVSNYRVSSADAAYSMPDLVDLTKTVDPAASNK